MTRLHSSYRWMKSPALFGAAVALMIFATASPAWAAGPGGYGFPWVSWAVGIGNLAVFLGIIIYFAGPRINDFFLKRRDTLVFNLEESSRLRKEAEARLEEYSARLDALEVERQKLLDEYHAQGEREKERIIEGAKKQVEKMRSDAELTIQHEVKKAIADLEEQAVNLAVGMAHTLVNERLNAAHQVKLVDNYVTELKEIA